MTDYQLDPLPRDEKGKVDRIKYQELMWFSQQRQEQDICRMNGTLTSHEIRITDVESDVKVAKILSKASTAILGLSVGLLGALKALKWW